jgi:hypothetical protein
LTAVLCPVPGFGGCSSSILAQIESNALRPSMEATIAPMMPNGL